MAKDAGRQQVEGDALREAQSPSAQNAETLAKDVAGYLHSHPSAQNRVDLIDTLKQSGLNQQELAKLGFPQINAPSATPAYNTPELSRVKADLDGKVSGGMPTGDMMPLISDMAKYLKTNFSQAGVAHLDQTLQQLGVSDNNRPRLEQIAIDEARAISSNNQARDARPQTASPAARLGNNTFAPREAITHPSDAPSTGDSADAIATRQRMAAAAGHHTSIDGRLGNCASAVQNDMIQADPSFNKWAGSGRWNQPGQPKGAWTMGQNMLKSGEFVQVDPKDAQPGDIIFFHDQNPKDAGDVQMIRSRTGDTYQSWNDKSTPYIDNVNGLGDKPHARIGGMYDHSMVLRFVGDHEYNPRPDATGASNREPLETWTQGEARGAAARTPGGRDIEKIALSKLGKTIDDGYASEGCMDSISQHIVKPHLANLGLAASYKGFNNTQEFIAWAKQHPELVEVQTVAQPSLSSTAIDSSGRKMLEPGDVVIGNKIDGPHAMVAARITGRWNGSDSALTLLGNTGHPEYVVDGPDRSHFRYQEFIGTTNDEEHFSPYHGGPESKNPANPFYKTDAHGRPTSTWTIIRFKQ